MAEPEPKPGAISTQDTNPGEPKHPFLLFQKWALQIPFFNPPRNTATSVPKEEAAKVSGVEKETTKPNLVSFPNSRPIVLPLETEVEESTGRTHNPVVIWQVYALGGFIILKWVWARWEERNERAKKASADDDQSPDDEYQSPAGDEA